MREAVHRTPQYKIEITKKSHLGGNIFGANKERVVKKKKPLTLVQWKLGHLELSAALSSQPLA